MRLSYIYKSKRVLLLAAASLLLFSSCEKRGLEDDGDLVPLLLSGKGIELSTDALTKGVEHSSDPLTKADENFSSRRLSLVAVNATSASQQTDVAMWIDNYYLNHVRVDGRSNLINSENEIRLNPVAYWPFNPAEHLFLVAYSPRAGSGTGADTRIARSGTTNNLVVTANSTTAFPDLLFSDMKGPWNKVTAQTAPNRTLSMGEFNHAMAKVVVELKLVDENGDDIPSLTHPYPPHTININELKIESKRTSGTFKLTEPVHANKWEYSAPLATEITVAPFITSATPLVENHPKYTTLLLPENEGDNYLSITIDEGLGAPFTRKFALPLFTDGGTPVELEMGKTTLLTIKLKYALISDPNSSMELKGQLVDWNYKGESEVTIE